MHTKKILRHMRATPAAGWALVIMAASGLAAAQAPVAGSPAAAELSADSARHRNAADKHVNDAVIVIEKMRNEPRMPELLAQAKGIFVVPTYGRAALGIGAEGGAGVLLVKHADGSWGDPAFYNLGGLSAGAQIGAQGGAIALILNNDKAVNKFMQNNMFSVNAAAGLTVVNWSKMAQRSLGDGDVVAWSSTKGLYGNLVAVGVNDIRYNRNTTNAYYGHNVALADVLAGKVTNPHAEPLKQALAAKGAASAAAR